MKHITLLTAGILLALPPWADVASAQRVQFPTAAPGAATGYDVTPIPGSSAPPTTYAAPQAAPAQYAQPYAQPQPYTPAPTMPPPTASSPYPATPYTPSPYGAPQVGPPPVFDPYASGNTLTPSAPTAPYSYTPPGTTAPGWPGQAPVQPYSPTGPPPPASAYPQQPGCLYPEGAPIQWQQGTYGCQGQESYWVKTQRFLQELSFEYTYLYGNDNDPQDLEMNRGELSGTFAIPIFYNIDTPLLVTPGFAANYWRGQPIAVGSAWLYDAYLDFAWYPRVNPWLGAELGFRTGVWSDFKKINNDSIRFLGRGLASISLTPQFDVLLGGVYLDRVDIQFLPAGGFYWRPTPEWDLYIVFPNPKVRKYFTSIGNSKWFWYVAGEYGGGSWTVQVPAGVHRIDEDDIRVFGGLEWETQTLIRGHVEVGYVWNRKAVEDTGAGVITVPLNDTVMVRGGIDF